MNGLSVEFCKVKFGNPFVLPSGIITEIPSHDRAVKAGAGAVTLKSVTALPREGNPLPRLWKYDHGILNSVGLRNPGIDKAVSEWSEFIKATKIPVIVSVFAVNVPDFVHLA